MRSEYRVSSPSSQRLTVNKPISTVRSTAQSPAIYEPRLSEVREHSNPSVSPTVSFGVAGSTLNRGKLVTVEGGDTYEGDLNSLGEFHGSGRYVFRNKGLEYQGMFQNGAQNGRGQLFRIQSSSNGHYDSNNSGVVQRVLLYEGDWKDGKKHGEGKYFYDSSQEHYYQGSWQNDERHGNLGTYVGPIGTYVGRWKHGRMNGKGKLKVAKSGAVYSGDFQDNQFVKGLITYANGDEYNGQTRNGLRDDKQGRYAYNNFQERASRLGSAENIVKYVGGWKNDMKEDESGEATIIYPSGETLKGTFDKGQFSDSMRCTYQWPDKTNFNGWIKRQNGMHVFKGIVKSPDGKVYEV